MIDKSQTTNNKSQKEVKSVTVRLNGVRISAQKLNLTAKILRGKDLTQARLITQFAKTKASEILNKVLKSAQAAATSKGMEAKKLFVKTLLANQGPSLKRGRAVSRGTYHAIRKKSAHVLLTLEEVDYGTKN